MRVRLTRKHFISTFFAVTTIFVLLGAASSCDGGATGDEQIDKAVSGRWRNYDRATSKYPDPQLTNFPLRKLLVEMTEREDKVNHPWYIYLYGQNGNMLGHYVGETAPFNACNFLSSTEDIYQDDSGGNMPVQAPSLDGVFYGNSNCDVWVFIDVASNSMVKFRGLFHASEAPMILEAESQRFVIEDVQD